MQESIWLANLFVYGIFLFVLLFIARFVFSIGRIIRDQEKIIKILSGIAIKMNVDSNYLK